MNTLNKFPGRVISAVILIGAYLLFPFTGNTFSGAFLPGAAAASSAYSIYLPLVTNGSEINTPTIAPLPPIFGAEFWNITSGGGLTLMTDTNMSWTRRNAVEWSKIQPNDPIGGEPSFIWSAMADLETDLQNASSRGMQVILIVNSSPEWARKIAGTGPTCGPIAKNKLAAFATFMKALVARYSVAPYNIKYWELGNEEDAPYIPGDLFYGCWGDTSDAYYGGGYYAEMLKVIYPQIKTADAQAQVLIGGLVLDCDPRPGAGCSIVGNDSRPPRFLEGILKNGGGPYFDGVSFHAYDYYMGKIGQYYSPNWSSAWNTTGPSSIAKAKFIKSVLSKYNVSGKFLMTTETSLLCGDENGEMPTQPVNLCLSTEFDSTKASFLAQTYTGAITEGIRATIWYCVMDGWRHSGLLSSPSDISTTYTAFKFAQSELRNAASTGNIVAGDIGGGSGVKGFKFQRDGHTVWVIWSLDGKTHSIKFLAGVPAATEDLHGVSITSKSTMDISLEPMYVEWNL
jgi:hypothetical protein